MSRTRLALVSTTCLLSLLANGMAYAQPTAPGAPSAARLAPRPVAPSAARPNAARPSAARPSTGVIRAVRVEGNQRIEESTVLSYMSVQPGDRFDADRIDRSLKTLYATGLFSDVRINRDGDTLVVRVAENPIVNRVAFEGNRLLTDEQLTTTVQLRARSVYTAAQAQADRQRILDAYAKRSRYAATVVPKVIQLDQNRVDLVFEINDGGSTWVSRIAFVGNHAFGEGSLRDVINSREQRWWRLLSTSDSYDPERLNYDKELLRRFYLKNGYADFKVTDATAELTPDREAFFVTFVVDEGERYRVGKVGVNSQIPNVDSASLQKLVDIDAGDWYDGDAVDRASNAIIAAVQQGGQPFVEVNPRITRDPKTHTIDLVFDVVQGPRVYVERIDIVGNTRTKDKVIRREFETAEGDAFDAAEFRRTRQRLQDLGYFTNVTVTPGPGSAPDRTVVTTAVEEKATGELTIGGGYSTDIGALANIGLRERNLVGTGLDASIGGIIAQKQTSVTASLTDPYFLDRNLAAGVDLFDIVNNNQAIAQYNESRLGFTLRAGYAINDHLTQSWAYSLIERNVYSVQTGASIYVRDQAGKTLLSQPGTVISLDYRDSKTNPHTGFIVRYGVDWAGAGGDVYYLRNKIDGAYYIPLDYFTGNSDWGIAESGGFGYLYNEGHQEYIIDRFFLGGDNLRGFAIGGAGPHDLITSDSLGGRQIWTESTELRFPLPISPDIGISGRAFVDVGALTQSSTPALNPATGVTDPISNYAGPRVGVGVGISWNTPFGLINIDLGDAIVKHQGDQTQVFRFGFGTRF